MTGCDIHMYVEYRRKLPPTSTMPNPWKSFNQSINPGRNYALFGFLANVKTKMGNPFPPKGFPPDAGYFAMDDNYLYIDDTLPDSRCVTQQTAELYVSEYGCHITEVERTGQKWVSNPNWHTHSWMTTDEFKEVMQMYNRQHKDYPEVEYEALLSVMKTFERKGYQARVLFWFEN